MLGGHDAVGVQNRKLNLFNKIIYSDNILYRLWARKYRVQYEYFSNPPKVHSSNKRTEKRKKVFWDQVCQQGSQVGKKKFFFSLSRMLQHRGLKVISVFKMFSVFIAKAIFLIVFIHAYMKCK